MIATISLVNIHQSILFKEILMSSKSCHVCPRDHKNLEHNKHSLSVGYLSQRMLVDFLLPPYFHFKNPRPLH